MRKTIGLTVLMLLSALAISCSKKQEAATAKLPLVKDVKIEKVAAATDEAIFV